MAARRACLECGAKKGVRAVTLYDDTDVDAFTSSKVHYCPSCLEKLDLICHEHNALKIPMLRVSNMETGVEEEAEGGGEIEEYSIITVDACPLCARDKVSALLTEERVRILLLADKLTDVATNILLLATYISSDVFKELKPADQVIFSFVLAAQFEKLSVQDFIFELFRQESSESETKQ
ncbi:MAG: hypothetical protein Q8P36_02295 [bacterium]|nr:hypothetical protein [bacterium]